MKKKLTYTLVIECDEEVLDSEVYDVIRDTLNEICFRFDWSLEQKEEQ